MRFFIPFICASVLSTTASAQTPVEDPAPTLPYELEHPYQYRDYIPDTTGTRLQTGLYFNRASKSAVWRHYKGREVSILPTPFATRRHISSISLVEDVGPMTPGYGVIIRFTPAGAKALKAATRKALGESMVVVLANRVMMVANVAAVNTAGELSLPLSEYNRAFVEQLVEEVRSEEASSVD